MTDRLFSRRTVLFVLLPLAFFLANAPTSARPAPSGFAHLAERLLPSVVNVQVTQIVKTSKRGGFTFEYQAPPGSQLEELFRRFREQQQGNGEKGSQRRRSQGSGFIIDAKGLVVTNNHVVDKAKEIFVVLQEGTRLKAEVIGRDKLTDLALLRIRHDKPLPVVKWGESDKTRVGDWVMAIGNPLGFGGSVTAGIVSARGRRISSGPYDDFIQTDAPINRGNSGGPLFNLAGKVIGVNTAIVSPNGGSIGIGFAIPSQIARSVIRQIERFGAPQRGWMGIGFQPVTEEIADSLKMPKKQGVIVTEVFDKGPAKRAGVKSGDVLLSYNNKKIGDGHKLPLMVAETPIGKVVPLEVLRQGKKRALRMKVGLLDEKRLGARSGSPAEGERREQDKTSVEDVKRIETLGVSVLALTSSMRAQPEIADDLHGLLITETEPKSAERGLAPGLVILSVEGYRTPSVAKLKQHLQKARGKKAVLLKLVDRLGKNPRYIGIPLKKK